MKILNVYRSEPDETVKKTRWNRDPRPRRG